MTIPELRNYHMTVSNRFENWYWLIKWAGCGGCTRRENG